MAQGIMKNAKRPANKLMNSKAETQNKKTETENECNIKQRISWMRLEWNDQNKKTLAPTRTHAATWGSLQLAA